MEENKDVKKDKDVFFTRLKPKIVNFFALFGVLFFILLALAIVYVLAYPKIKKKEDGAKPTIPIADGVKLYNEMQKTNEEKARIRKIYDARDYYRAKNIKRNTHK